MKNLLKVLCISIAGLSLAMLPSVSLASPKKARSQGHTQKKSAKASKKVSNNSKKNNVKTKTASKKASSVKSRKSTSKHSNARSKVKQRKLISRAQKIAKSNRNSRYTAKATRGSKGRFVASRRHGRQYSHYRSRHQFAQVIAPPAPTPQVVRYDTDNVASSSASDDLLMNAMSLLGISYRFGGSTPMRGLDCSGFIQYVYRETLNIRLPRTAAAMAQVGTKIDKASLKPGDLIFFSHRNKRIGHVAMYIGDGKFIHSPRTGKDIEVQSLSVPYYRNHFVMARRIANGLNGGSSFVNN